VLAFGVWRRARGIGWRSVAAAMLLAILVNPSLVEEKRSPLRDIAVVVVDESPSQEIGNRRQATEAAVSALTERLGHERDLDVRVIRAGKPQPGSGDDGTKLFTALARTMSDIPKQRLAATIMITDGQVHDIPAAEPAAAAQELGPPLHVLLSGRPDERDRRLVIAHAPSFGLVGKEAPLTIRVEDSPETKTEGKPETKTASPGAPERQARLTWRKDGAAPHQIVVPVGRDVPLAIPIEHGGPNVLELDVEPGLQELTLANNRAAVVVNGVRDRLRVLLVSGEPHAGERVWRNILKSDPSVDLVHFTILRPPEKQDGTPINELSLIAFPTRELFQQRINDFHLIIFDRYARQGVLPIAYFDNIARYVRAGGAVLVSAGPDYASTTSIWRTPLDSVLPAEPVGVTEKPFYAHLSDAGKRHPVTRGLEGSASEPPHWSRFFRTVETRNATSPPVMTGADGKPLLLLSRFGEGRVALLLSDHIWLWARGYEGGGPHLDLLRRMSHWLMKQPDLDEEALRLQIQGKDLVVLRQTMADSVTPVTVTSPSGATRELTLSAREPGTWRSTIPASELGLWQATDGTLKALINVGPTNPKEFSEVTSTTEMLKPLTQATGGDARRVVDGSSIDLPRIVPVRASGVFRGDGWMGVKMRDASVVKGVGVLPVFAGLIGLLLLLGAFAATWLREGR
jgi:hypothetical protein